MHPPPLSNLSHPSHVYEYNSFYVFHRRKPLSSKAMKLGGKSKDVEGFVDQLMQEGEHVASLETSKKQPGVTTNVAAQPQIKNER